MIFEQLLFEWVNREYSANRLGVLTESIAPIVNGCAVDGSNYQAVFGALFSKPNFLEFINLHREEYQEFLEKMNERQNALKKIAEERAAAKILVDGKDDFEFDPSTPFMHKGRFLREVSIHVIERSIADSLNSLIDGASGTVCVKSLSFEENEVKLSISYSEVFPVYIHGNFEGEDLERD